jgi:uncharacterized damage-inducible protein DinB
MSTCEHIVLMAAYNEAMNDKLYAAAAQLPPAALFEDRKAFFGSLFATLNHLAVADTIWLKRFCAHPARQAALDVLRDGPVPAALSQPLAADLPGLLALRRRLDRIIRQWANELTPADLEHVLRYANTKGVVSHKRYASLILHFFNHQTHHRGQATTLLTQSGVDVGVTDLLMLIPNEDGAVL